MNFDENLADFGCGLDEESSMSKNAAAFLKSYARTCTIFNAVGEVTDREKKQDIVKKYLDYCYDAKDGKLQKPINVVSLSVSGSGFESITSRNVPDLMKGSVSTMYLIEFFTHCCINCIHSIEDVREVREVVDGSFPKNSLGGFAGLKVISIHSPKFTREKDVESIKAFCKRMKMEYSDVVNDPTCILWNELGVTCWPTLLILGPNPEGTGPNLLFSFMGEDHKEDLSIAIKTAMEYFQEKFILDNNVANNNADTSVVDSVDGNVSARESNSFLRFPGKVNVHGDTIAISDSGNNRIVLVRSTGHVIDIIGGPEKGNKDGSFGQARFYNPQGIAFESDSVLYITDTGNHSIRKVDLTSKHVSTLITAGQALQINQESIVMKSPWDLCFYDTNTLIIAAAGNHRLFGYFFKDSFLFGNEHKEATLAVIAGSGREENRNNSYIMKASFAQPSGIVAIMTNDNDKVIFIADSESSSIRSVTAKSQVTGIVGGSRDPTDLFAFGDMDGKGINAKLQHPMGVCSGPTSSEIFVADTYNHKIKRVDYLTKECTTFISSGLDEPSGLCKDAERGLLYVADTNNHVIKIIEIKTGKVQELEIIAQNHMTVDRSLLIKFDKLFQVPIAEEVTSVKLNFVFAPLPNAYEGGQWKAVKEQYVNFVVDRGDIDRKDANEGHFSLIIQDLCVVTEFYVVADVFFCGPSSCVKRTRKVKVICRKEFNTPKEVEKTLQWDSMVWDV